MKSFTLLLLLTVTASAQPAEDADDEIADLPRLETVTHAIRYSKACSPSLMNIDSDGLALPAKTKKGLRYRMPFVRLINPDSRDSRVSHITVLAEFDEHARNIVCGMDVPMPRGSYEKPLDTPLLSPELKKMDFDRYEKQVHRYHEVLAVVGPAFTAGKRDAVTRKAAAEFRRLFTLLSPPGLAVQYRALSPEFWIWLDEFEKPLKKP